MILSKPRESMKGKKVLDHEVMLERSNGNWENIRITIKPQTPMDKQKLATNTIVQKGLGSPTLKVDQIDFNVDGQKKLARLISQIGQASCKQNCSIHMNMDY